MWPILLSSLLILTGCGRGSSVGKVEDPPQPEAPDNIDATYHVTPNDVGTSYDVATYNGISLEIPLTLSATTSIGCPSHGKLSGAMPLPLEGPGFLFNPEKNPERRYGTVELVRAIVRAAAHVHQLLPGSKLVVGDLSLPDGGPLPGHATHRNGRDVDVCFYLLTASGNPFPAKPIPIEPDGTGVDYRDLSDGTDDIPVRLDAKRTWSFLHALLTDPDVSVNRIFVAEHIRKILLQQAKAEGANPDVQERFGHVTCQPSFPHDDHMHIRLFCSLDDIDAGCEDTPPIYPWHARYLASHDRTARLPRPRPSRAEVTSVAEAAKNAERKFGSLHPDVTAFLKRRETWVRKPSPGRPYCP